MHEATQDQSEKASGKPSGSERAGYSIAETAVMFGVSQWNIRMAIKDGEIRVLRFGRRVVIPRSEIKRLMG